MKNVEKEFYDESSDWNFDQFEIESEHFTNWDMFEILKKITNKDSKILDLGTGGGERVLTDFPEVKEILGTDFSEDMIKTANENLKKSKKKNIKFKVMDNLKMDVPENYYDVVVARNTVTDPKSIYKCLKKGGYLLIHGVDKYDLWELKRTFGVAQNCKNNKPISIADYENVLDAGFKDVELVPIHDREYFKSEESLAKFLLKIPFFVEFDEEGNDITTEKKSLDLNVLEKYIKRNTYSKGIRLLRNYYGILAKK